MKNFLVKTASFVIFSSCLNLQHLLPTILLKGARFTSLGNRLKVYKQDLLPTLYLHRVKSFNTGNGHLKETRFTAYNFASGGGSLREIEATSVGAKICVFILCAILTWD
jgi:hypothetical protein